MNGQFIKAAGKGFLIETPVGDLEWTIIAGQGKLNTLNDKYYYVSTLVLPEDKAQPLIDEINEFWKTNRPPKFKNKEPKSLGYYPHKVSTGEKDEHGDTIYKETGNIAFSFKTETTYRDGNPKKIVTFNSKGNEVNLGNKKVGNGSRGRIKGAIAIYEQVRDAGASLYLNSIQLSKFVEFVGGDTFTALEDEDGDGFEGVDDGMEGMEAGNEQTETAPSTPRL